MTITSRMSLLDEKPDRKVQLENAQVTHVNQAYELLKDEFKERTELDSHNVQNLRDPTFEAYWFQILSAMAMHYEIDEADIVY